MEIGLGPVCNDLRICNAAWIYGFSPLLARSIPIVLNIVQGKESSDVWLRVQGSSLGSQFFNTAVSAVS